MIRCITGTSILILGLGLVFLTRQNALEPVNAKVAPIDTMKREALVNTHRESVPTIPLPSSDKAEPEVDRTRDHKVVEGLQRFKAKTAHITKESIDEERARIAEGIKLAQNFKPRSPDISVEEDENGQSWQVLHFGDGIVRYLPSDEK